MSRGVDVVRVQRIGDLVRMPSSHYGNPRFRVFFEDGSNAPTQPDSMIAYGAENPEWRGVDLEVHYNGRGHVTWWRHATETTTETT